MYKNTYTDKVRQDFLLVYNPLTEKGITVLNKEAAFLFKLINGKRTIKDIQSIAKQKDPTVKIKDIISIFNNFISSEIAYIHSPKNKKALFYKKPTHLGVWLHITNQCNLRCTYCYVHKTSDSMNENSAKKSLEKIIFDAKKHLFKKITIKFSGGECLLKLPLILDLIHLGKKLSNEAKIDIEFVILTNGVLLTEKTVNILKEEGVRVAVSLDGLKKYHDAQRIFSNGLGSFKFVENGINNLLKVKIPFNVSITITSKNVENIPNLTKYLLKKNIPFAFNFYRENSYVKEKLEGDNEKLIKYLTKAYKIIYDNPPKQQIINGLLDRVSFRQPHQWTCGMGHNYIVVRQDGKIVSCQMTLEKPIGSINKGDSIKTMLNGNFVKPKNLTVEDKKPCNTCQWKYVCCGGCPLLTYKQKKSYKVNSPYCTVYKKLIPKVLQIEAKRIIKYAYPKLIDDKTDLSNSSPL